MKNIDYNFYTERFGGDLLSAQLLPAYIARAIIYLNSITFNQAGSCDDINIDFAICDIAEQIYKEHMYRGIQSESVDGYSLTMDTSPFDERLYNTAQTYLACSGLLYRGGSCYD